jgi:hypothetical protein
MLRAISVAEIQSFLQFLNSTLQLRILTNPIQSIQPFHVDTGNMLALLVCRASAVRVARPEQSPSGVTRGRMCPSLGTNLHLADCIVRLIHSSRTSDVDIFAVFHLDAAVAFSDSGTCPSTEGRPHL